MSFPIYRVDLQDVSSSKLDLSSVVLPETATFVEKRVLHFSKQVTDAAKKGDKKATLKVVIEKNVEPVSAGLKVNFPDVTLTVNPENKPVGPKMPTTVVIDWS